MSYVITMSWYHWIQVLKVINIGDSSVDRCFINNDKNGNEDSCFGLIVLSFMIASLFMMVLEVAVDTGLSSYLI